MFSDLPWFIRKDVVNYVIDDNPRYCSVNKEWLRCVALKHGELRLLRQETGYDTKRPVTLFTQHIKRIYFNRSEEIDWDTIFCNKNINYLSIGISNKDRSLENNEMVFKCSKLPPLNFLYLSANGDNTLDLSHLLKNNHRHLKEISISINSEVCHHLVESTMFPKLISLELSGHKYTLSTQKIINNMPELKRLIFRFTMPSGLVLFDHSEVPNIVELDLDCFIEGEGTTMVNMKNLPNLRKLRLTGEFQFNTDSFKGIKELDIEGYMRYISPFLRNDFTNLQKLRVCHYMASNLPLFENCSLPNLSDLELDGDYCRDDGMIYVELASLPNLDKIRIYGKFKLLNTNPLNHIRELHIDGSTEYLSRTVCDNFPKLNILYLHIDEYPNTKELPVLLQYLTTITELHLSFRFTADQLTDLPDVPYTATTLSLRGQFYFTSHLLLWLSKNFNLKKLELHGYSLGDGALLNILSFDHLEHIIITAKADLRDQFEQYFNKKNYPHIKKIEIVKCFCFECNHSNNTRGITSLGTFVD